MRVIKNARTRIRLPVAAFTTLRGEATAIGGLLTWVSARGPRPRLGIDHTSFSKLLVYSFANGSPFWQSAGFAVLVLGVLMVIGALAGLRTLTVLAALLALGAAGGVDRGGRAPLQHADPAERALRQPGEPALVRPARGRLADDCRRSARGVSAFWLRRRIREPARGAVAAGRDRLD